MNHDPPHPSESNPAYRIYVVRLADHVARRPRVREKNPQYEPGRPVVYVGSTKQPIERRYAQHRRGGMYSNGYVRRFGRRLFPWAYEGLPVHDSREAAIHAERAYAEELRGRGWAVWQA
jgi:predicted GIY-YIG superfamily endonuclease